MIQKLKDVSNIILVLTVTLYFFGFICLNAYYARFGIVSFDIVNSRFIIAGIFPLISMCFVIFLTYWYYSYVPLNKLIRSKNFSEYGIHFKLLIFTVFSASILRFLMHLGAYTPPSNKQSLIFKPLLGSHDIIGNFIARISDGYIVSINYIFKLCLYIFAYLLLLVLLVFVLVMAYEGTKLLYKKVLKNRNNEPNTHTARIEPEKDSGEKKKTPNWYIPKLYYIGNIFIFSLYLALVVYSYRRLGVDLFDFQSFTKFEPVSEGLVFAWLFSSISIIYIFLFNAQLPSEQLKLGFAKHISEIWNWPWTLQQLIIPVLGSLIVFGATIFPKIPFAIGGGEPRLVRLTMIDSSQNFNDEKMFLIGESSQFFFVISTTNDGKNGRALQINKSEIAYIETKSIGEESKSEINTEP